MAGRLLLLTWEVLVSLALLLTMEEQLVVPTILLADWEAVFLQAIHRLAIVSNFTLIHL